jgi:signal transduction histidine kinase
VSPAKNLLASERASGPNSAIGKLLRTTAFRLTLAYLAIFVVFAGFVLGYVAFNARNLLNDQLRTGIDTEIAGLIDQYRIGGIRRLVIVVERRAREPGASLYLVTTFAGERLVGNVSALPPGALERAGERVLEYARGDETDARPHRALVKVELLPGGFRVLVGRDLEEQDRFREVIRRALGWSLALVVVLGCLGGWFITRRVLKRVDAMTETTRTIMTGNLAGRLTIAGTGDELDRLAQNLNEMLDRIGELMTGLKEVSDNIAHDLKTPLTRLRNRAEEALRTASVESDYRAALEATIEESDNLIRVFNALLMIARLEAGQSSESFTPVDVSNVARGVVELYEPLAEEAGGDISLDVANNLTLQGSRELIGQALSNLLDNAFKYAMPGMIDDKSHQTSKPVIKLTAHNVDSDIEIIIADNGPGIPMKDRARSIERFARLESARSRPGFGLGLSLVSAVARLHGGTLTLDDNHPGLRAILRLPNGSLKT